MADQKSVFQPLTAADFTGPFSGFLQPPQPTPTEQTFRQAPPPAPLSKLGGLAEVATSFLQGATQGRIRKYEMEQNAKLQKINVLNSYMAQIMNDPDLTDDAKRMASQQYYRAIGGDLMEATKGVGKGDSQGSTQAHHFGNIMKDLATGLTGGKAPKGAPDPGDAITAIHAQLYGPDGKPKPQFTVAGQSSGYMSQADKIYSQYPPGTPPEVVAGNPDLAKLKAAWQRTDPQGAAVYFGSREQAYPATLSASSEEQRLSNIGQRQNTPSQPPGPGSSAQPVDKASRLRMATQGPPSLAAPSPTASVSPNPGGSPAGVAGGLTGMSLNGSDLQLLKKHGRIRQGDDWETPDGRRISGRVVELDSGPIFIDAKNRQVDVDINSLVPWEGRQAVNIVDPKDPYRGISALRDKSTGLLYDHSGIPLPPGQQGWQETTAMVRPPTTGQRPVYVDHDGHPVFRSQDGTLTKSPDTVYQKPEKPDRFAEHYKIEQEGRLALDDKRAARQITTQRNANLVRINLNFDNKIAAVDKDPNPLFKPKDRQKAKADLEEQRKKELAAEDQIYSEAMDAFGEPPSAAPSKKTTTPLTPPPGPGTGVSQKVLSRFE